eukprot:tig00001532_g9271.t1
MARAAAQAMWGGDTARYVPGIHAKSIDLTSATGDAFLRRDAIRLYDSHAVAHPAISTEREDLRSARSARAATPTALQQRGTPRQAEGPVPTPAWVNDPAGPAPLPLPRRPRRARATSSTRVAKSARDFRGNAHPFVTANFEKYEELFRPSEGGLIIRFGAALGRPTTPPAPREARSPPHRNPGALTGALRPARPPSSAGGAADAIPPREAPPSAGAGARGPGAAARGGARGGDGARGGEQRGVRGGGVSLGFHERAVEERVWGLSAVFRDKVDAQAAHFEERLSALAARFAVRTRPAPHPPPPLLPARAGARGAGRVAERQADAGLALDIGRVEAAIKELEEEQAELQAKVREAGAGFAEETAAAGQRLEAAQRACGAWELEAARVRLPMKEALELRAGVEQAKAERGRLKKQLAKADALLAEIARRRAGLGGAREPRQLLAVATPELMRDVEAFDSWSGRDPFMELVTPRNRRRLHGPLGLAGTRRRPRGRPDAGPRRRGRLGEAAVARLPRSLDELEVALQVKEARVRNATRDFVRNVASIINFDESLRVDLACPRCFSTLAFPVTLAPCGHTFCMKCYREVQAAAEGRSPCPECAAYGDGDAEAVEAEHPLVANAALQALLAGFAERGRMLAGLVRQLAALEAHEFHAAQLVLSHIPPRTPSPGPAPAPTPPPAPGPERAPGGDTITLELPPRRAPRAPPPPAPPRPARPALPSPPRHPAGPALPAGEAARPPSRASAPALSPPPPAAAPRAPPRPRPRPARRRGAAPARPPAPPPPPALGGGAGGRPLAGAVPGPAPRPPSAAGSSLARPASRPASTSPRGSSPAPGGSPRGSPPPGGRPQCRASTAAPDPASPR